MVKKMIIVLFLVAITFANVESEYNPSRYTGDGSTVAFTFDFPIEETTDLEVIVMADDSEEILTETTDYEVSAVNNDYSDGGTVTMVATYSSDDTILIRRTTPQTQDETLISDTSVLRLETLVGAYDKLTKLVQELQEEVDRAYKRAKSDDPTLTSITGPNDTEVYLYLDDGGDLTAKTTVDPGSLSLTSWWNTRLGTDPNSWFKNFSYDANETEARGTIEVTKKYVYDIREYGAIAGDSVDDSSAIQAAIDAAFAADGGQVLIPSGTWNVTTTIDFTSQDDAYSQATWIKGAGRENSIVFVQNVDVGFDWTLTSACRMSDMTIINDGTSKVALLLARGTSGGSCNGNFIENMYFGNTGPNFKVAQIYGVGPENTHIQNCYFEQSGLADANNPRHAIYISSHDTYDIDSPTEGEIGSPVSTIFNHIAENQFYNNTMTGEPVAIMLQDNTSRNIITDNDFGGTGTAIKFNSVNSPNLGYLTIMKNKFEMALPGAYCFRLGTEYASPTVTYYTSLNYSSNEINGTRPFIADSNTITLVDFYYARNHCSPVAYIEFPTILKGRIIATDDNTDISQMSGQIWSACEITGMYGRVRFSGTHGCFLRLLDEYDSGNGIHRDIYGYSSDGTVSGSVAHLPQIYPLTSDLSATQRDLPGIFAVADNATWDPLNIDGAKPYPVFFSDPNWVSLGVHEFESDTNTPGGATVKAMPVYDSDGTLVGYVPVYGAKW